MFPILATTHSVGTRSRQVNGCIWRQRSCYRNNGLGKLWCRWNRRPRGRVRPRPGVTCGSFAAFSVTIKEPVTLPGTFRSCKEILEPLQGDGSKGSLKVKQSAEPNPSNRDFS